MNVRLALIALTAFLTLNLGSALAQETPAVVFNENANDQAWVGISTGFPFGATLHLGLNNIFADNADARFIGSFYGDEYGLGLDALYGFGITDDRMLDLYVGGGPLLSLGKTFAFGVNAIAGLEYRLNVLGFPSGGVFAEAGPYLGFGDETFLDFNARFGFDYHF